MSAAEWAQQIEELQRKPPFPGVAVLVPHKARELAALLRRAERVEAAVDAVAPDLVGATIYVDDVLNGGDTDNLRRASEMLATVRHTLNAALEGRK